MKGYTILSTIAAAGVLLAASCTQSGSGIVTPDERQIEWADAEIGVMFHLDMQVFNPGYEWREFGTHPDVSTFNPTELDTDQWLEAASKINAKYAVLVAKHCSGFSLWPTEAHDYSVKNCPWQNGQGDIVRDFIQSCKKYGIKPGIYASTSANGYYHVDNPGVVQPGSPYTQEEYRAVVQKQLTELWSNYGELFEIWFDGGVLPVDQGGYDVGTLARKLQPEAIAFQGSDDMKHLIRWVGNETGDAPYPCWATSGATTSADGTTVMSGMNGAADGAIWCPGEADCTLRLNNTFQAGWMWSPGYDDAIYSVSKLVRKYETSVGRNTNLLLGLVVDNRGLVPEGDVARLEEFGKALEEKYGTPLASVSGKGNSIVIDLDKPRAIDRIVIQEDISLGERVLEYQVEGLCADGTWTTLSNGTNIGHKRIDTFSPIEVSALKLQVKKSKGKPAIRNFSVFEVPERSAQRVMFEDGNYAMFIHFGLYSQLEGTWAGKPYFGNAEWIMNEGQAGIPIKDYKALSAEFNPSEFNAEEIVSLARDAGMKYIIITSKHHEGFAMFDSDADGFNIKDGSPFGRDLLGELAEACHRNGLGIGFYYSQFQDWTAPGGGNGPATDAAGRKVSFEEYFRNKVVPQVTELLTKYGPIELIWFDTPGDMQEHYSRELVDLVHELQPGTLVSSRVGNGMGDYETLGDMEVPLENVEGLWEGIDVTQVGWGYNRNDSEWKSPDYIVRTLTATIARGGTFMLNVGPTAKGAIAHEAAASLRKAGEWVRKYPDAVYGAGPSPWGHAFPWGDAVTQHDRILLIVHDWPADGKLHVPGVTSEIRDVRLYGSGSLAFSTEAGWTTIELPFPKPEGLSPVIEICCGSNDIQVTQQNYIDPSSTTELSVLFGEHGGCSKDYRSWMDRFGEWKFKHELRDFQKECWLDWTVDFCQAGYYDLELEWAGGKQVLWQVELDGVPCGIDLQTTGSRFEFQRLGWIRIDKPGRHVVCLRPIEGDFEKTEVSAIRLTPVLQTLE